MELRHDRDWHLAEAERLLALAEDERDQVKAASLVRRAEVHVQLAREMGVRGR